MSRIEDVADKTIDFLLTQNSDDEYELFNSFIQKENIQVSFDEAKYLVQIFKRLLNTDKKILISTNQIIKERA